MTAWCVICEKRPHAVGLLCVECDRIYLDAAKALEELREAEDALTRAERDHLDGMRLDADTD